MCGRFAAENPLLLGHAFLPLGISFFTFEFIHYAVDRYKGRTEAGTAGEYLAFILFFPTMVAGPIKRYQDFLPKLRGDFARVGDGLAARNHAHPGGAGEEIRGGRCAHRLYESLELGGHQPRATAHILPLWLLAYGIKIYADFSAYSDIAIGSARLFGIRVPENFDWPYLRTNITEFWRHWHMSLTSWLIDYIYIPLGGSRVAERARVREYPGDDAGERHLAWRGSEFHRVGAAARRDAGGPAGVAAAASCGAGAAPSRLAFSAGC